MSGMGQTRKSGPTRVMSDLPRRADIATIPALFAFGL